MVDFVMGRTDEKTRKMNKVAMTCSKIFATGIPEILDFFFYSKGKNATQEDAETQDKTEGKFKSNV